MSLLANTVCRFRARRMRLFFAALGITERTRVLDVGGTPLNWMLAELRPRVTLVNMPIGIERAVPGFQTVSATGCELPFPDQSFDVVFSNSVIEHVGSPERQRRFAQEIARVGRAYWVQTPNRWFPVEPHLLTPFLHWLPSPVRAWVARRFSVWQWVTRPSTDRGDFYIEHFLADIRLLGPREMKRFFPDGGLIRERLLGLTKSLVAVRRAT